MPSIFSTQNLQTFLRRKNLRPPSRGPPPGPRPDVRRDEVRVDRPRVDRPRGAFRTRRWGFSCRGASFRSRCLYRFVCHDSPSGLSYTPDAVSLSGCRPLSGTRNLATCCHRTDSSAQLTDVLGEQSTTGQGFVAFYQPMPSVRQCHTSLWSRASALSGRRLSSGWRSGLRQPLPPLAQQRQLQRPQPLAVPCRGPWCRESP